MTTDEYPANKALHAWRHAGLDCVITHSLGQLCGYVRVPDDHPAYSAHYERVPADVHGGLTYGYRGWFGFHTAQVRDYWTTDALIRAGVDPAEAEKNHQAPLYGRPMRWTLDKIRAETNHLAEQLAELTEIDEPNSWQITNEELAHLRAERDTLRARIAELEAAK